MTKGVDAQGHWQDEFVSPEPRTPHHITEPNDAPLLTGDLNAHGALAGQRRYNPHTFRAQHAGDVVRDADDPRGLHSRARFIFQRRDYRPLGNVADPALNLEFTQLTFELLNQRTEVALLGGIDLAGLKHVEVGLPISGRCGGEVEGNLGLILIALAREYRLGGALAIFAIGLGGRFTCPRAGERCESSLAVLARRLAGQASQEKEQVFGKFCRIVNRQVPGNHQAGYGCKSQTDDRTTVTNTLEERVAEERADNPANTMGQICSVWIWLFNMGESGKNHQDERKAHKPFGFRPADKAEGHEPAAQAKHRRDQQAADPQGAEQKISEPSTPWSAHILVGFVRRGDLCQVAWVVGKESKAAKNTNGENHKPEQLKECTLLGQERPG